MSAAKLLDRLDRVKQTSPGKWVARCPAHQDRSPSLSIRELDDGRLLLHDFGGCSADEILAAVGLEMGHLFPERLPGSGPAGGFAPSRSMIPARDLLEVISEETGVVALVASDMLEHKTISAADWERLALAASRIHGARGHIRGR